jgi:hypothetical protein
MSARFCCARRGAALGPRPMNGSRFSDLRVAMTRAGIKVHTFAGADLGRGCGGRLPERPLNRRTYLSRRRRADCPWPCRRRRRRSGAAGDRRDRPCAAAFLARGLRIVYHLGGLLLRIPHTGFLWSLHPRVVPSERIQANKPRAPSRSSGALCAPSGGRLRRGGRRANRTVERSVPRSATRPAGAEIADVGGSRHLPPCRMPHRGSGRGERPDACAAMGWVLGLDTPPKPGRCPPCGGRRSAPPGGRLSAGSCGGAYELVEPLGARGPTSGPPTWSCARVAPREWI